MRRLLWVATGVWAALLILACVAYARTVGSLAHLPAAAALVSEGNPLLTHRAFGIIGIHAVVRPTIVDLARASLALALVMGAAASLLLYRFLILVSSSPAAPAVWRSLFIPVRGYFVPPSRLVTMLKAYRGRNWRSVDGVLVWSWHLALILFVFLFGFAQIPGAGNAPQVAEVRQAATTALAATAAGLLASTLSMAVMVRTRTWSKVPRTAHATTSAAV